MKKVLILFLIIFTMLISASSENGFFSDILQKLLNINKVNPASEKEGVPASEEVVIQRKDVIFFFEMDRYSYSFRDKDFIITNDFRENILQKEYFFLKFLDQFEIMNFILYIPPVNFLILDDFLNGNIDDKLRVSLKDYSELNTEDRVAFSKLFSIQESALTEEEFYDVIGKYHKPLIEDKIPAEDENWKVLKEKNSGFTKEEVMIILNSEISLLTEFREKLHAIAKSYSLEILTSSLYNSDPNFYTENTVLNDTSSISITQELSDGRSKFTKSSGYYPPNGNIFQEDIPAIAKGGYSYVILDKEIFNKSIKTIEYPELTKEEKDVFSNFIFYSVKKKDIIRFIFYSPEFSGLFNTENLKNYKENFQKIYDSTPVIPETDLFKKKEPLFIIKISKDEFEKYTKDDFILLEEAFNYILELKMFNFIYLKGALGKNNEKDEMFLLREINAQNTADTFANHNKMNLLSFSEIEMLHQQILELEILLRKIEDPEKKSSAETKLNNVKKIYLIWRSLYSDYQAFNREEFTLIFNIIADKITEIKNELPENPE
ncbi:MAG: hypothetical protein PHV06_03485 [bacterium]|nr:hypothetical protein [bacterium]